MEDIHEKTAQITVLAPAETNGVSAAPSETLKVEPTGNILRRHIKEDHGKKLMAKHRMWMDNLDLEKHIRQFTDDIALCKKWTLVDFYVDRGMNAPRMENAKESSESTNSDPIHLIFRITITNSRSRGCPRGEVRLDHRQPAALSPCTFGSRSGVYRRLLILL